MLSKNIQSPRQWTDLWLAKFSAECAARNILERDIRHYSSILEIFLTKNPGNPRQISLEKLKRFVKNRKNVAVPPLILFYQTIAYSNQHLDLLIGLAKTPARKKNKTR